MSATHNSSPRPSSFLPLALPPHEDLVVCGRLLLWFVAIGLDYVFVPALYNGSALWMAAALTLLTFRAGQSPHATDAKRIALAIPALTAARWAIFVALHVAIVLVARRYAGALASAVMSDAPGSAALASLKLAVLLPAIALFPLPVWRTLLRVYRAEWIAALVVLFAFFPYRVFHTIFPVYSKVIGRLAYYGAKPFVAGIGYSGGVAPTITAPRLDLQIVFACSGLSAIILFDILVALLAFLDWNELDRGRLLISYFAGCAGILIANIARISLLVLVGNLIAPRYAMGKFHINAGWIFFAVVYFGILFGSYRWMLQRPISRDPESRSRPLTSAS